MQNNTETNGMPAFYKNIKEELEGVNKYIDPENKLSFAEKLNLAVQVYSLQYQESILEELEDNTGQIMDLYQLIEESKKRNITQ